MRRAHVIQCAATVGLGRSTIAAYRIRLLKLSSNSLIFILSYCVFEFQELPFLLSGKSDMARLILINIQGWEMDDNFQPKLQYTLHYVSYVSQYVTQNKNLRDPCIL